MAGTLIQLSSLPVFALRNAPRNARMGSGTRTAPIIVTLSTHCLITSSSSVLRGSNTLGMIGSSKQHNNSSISNLWASIWTRKATARRGIPRAMFERFSDKAMKVITLSQEEARRLGHDFIGTEQILLGLVGEGTGIAAKVLKSMKITLKAARIEVEKINGRGSGFVAAVEIPFTPRAKHVLELSLEEARHLGTFFD